MKKDEAYYSRLKKDYAGLVVEGDMPQTLKNFERHADSYAKRDDSRALGEYFSLGISYGMIDDKKAVQRVGAKGKKAADRLAAKSGKTREQVLEDLAAGILTEIDKPGLGKRLAEVVGITGILGGLFLLSPNVTGNAIANVTNSIPSFLGIVFLIAGLVGAFFWVKK